LRLSRNIKAHWSRVFTVLAWIGLTGLLTGCDLNDFFNPGEPKIVGSDTIEKPLIVPVLDTLSSGVEEPTTAYAAATDIEPGDLIPTIEDYKMGPNDLVSVTIFDLLGEGTGDQVKTVHVTETGNISLPFIPPVKADGLTERQLEDRIQKAYERANVIRQARVTVSVEEGRQRTFTIQGNVVNPSEYSIPRNDYRMLDALALARAPASPTGVPYAYIIRKPVTAATSEPDEGSSDNAEPTTTPSNGGGDILAPTTAPSPQSRLAPLSRSERTLNMDETNPGAGSHIFRFDDVSSGINARIIRVPIEQLRTFGELKYNIVIRPGDQIFIPDPQNGVYYLGGHVARQGVYGLTGAKVNLKQAWIAAGGEDDFSIPSRSELIRRIGENKEVFVRVDMSKIWAGDEPDIYLKPNDVFQVGTNFFATFLASARNSFRLTYGFGFLYDRNFYTGPNGF
jgi:protein involved in polysaccharide export with SLBB domain